jgi:hypothetical protein
MTKSLQVILQVFATRIDRLLEMIASAFSQGMMHRRYFMSGMIASAFSLIASASSQGMMHRRYFMDIPTTLPEPECKVDKGIGEGPGNGDPVQGPI